MTSTDLDVLLGSWELTGRTSEADHDDITGDLTATRVLNGQLLLRGSMRVRDTEIHSLELVWPDMAHAAYDATMRRIV